jgi:hypothetical protein
MTALVEIASACIRFGMEVKIVQVNSRCRLGILGSHKQFSQAFGHLPMLARGCWQERPEGDKTLFYWPSKRITFEDVNIIGQIVNGGHNV